MRDAFLDYPTLGQALRMVSGSKCRRHQTGEGADHEPKRKLRFSRVPQFRFVLTTARVLWVPISQGNRTTSPYASVPTLTYWRLSALTRYLQLDEDKQVIASPNLTTSLGRRNQAILLLLARLGLRGATLFSFGSAISNQGTTLSCWPAERTRDRPHAICRNVGTSG